MSTAASGGGTARGGGDVSTAPSVEWEARADLVVVGGGVAGLSAARAAAARGLSVLILQKGGRGYGGRSGTSTELAQGGIAVARSGLDTPAAHTEDTCAAGGGLCDRGAVESIVADGERGLDSLIAAGAVFDRTADGRYAVTREGGHRTRRILHAGGDATGAEVQRALDAACTPAACTSAGSAGRITRMSGVTVLRVCMGVDGVCGVIVAAETGSGSGCGVVHAPSVLLATGGIGGLFTSSTNPPEATGDGIALALDAGAAVADLEFVQFHPTALYVGAGRGEPAARGRCPLVSEAVRGEGAVLVDAAGHAVTTGLHPMGDLAPRDVVARAIASRLRESGGDHVYLDARAVAGFARRFPTITAACRAIGVDPAVDGIPVTPAAHFSCGGVVTDLRGRTGVPGLLCAGEVARTGLHGANRLASNSLLEGIVMGGRAGAAAAARAGMRPEMPDAHFRVAPAAPRAAVQGLMTAHAAVIRSAESLAEAAAELPSGMGAALYTREGAEDAAVTLVARAVLLAAAARTETRGCHTRDEHPNADPRQARSIRMRLDGEGGLRVERAPGEDAARSPAGQAEYIPKAGALA